VQGWGYCSEHRALGNLGGVQQRTKITVLSYKAASNPNMAIPRPTPAPAVWYGAAPVAAADAEVREAPPEVGEALPEEVIEALPEEAIETLPEGAIETLPEGAIEALPAEGVALPDGHEGWVLTLMF
jgi:hypothetical protein